MLGNTHFIVGASAAVTTVAITGIGTTGNFSTFPVIMLPLITAAYFGAIGGLLPDIDLQGTFIRKHSQILWIPVLLYGIISVYRFSGAESIEEMIRTVPVSLYLFLGWFFVIVIACWHSNHRGFSHSFIACGMLTFCLYKYLEICFSFCSPELSFFPELVAGSFAIGYFSHLALDALNKSGCKYLYPIPASFCLNLTRSDSSLNIVLSVMALIVMFLSFYKILML